MAERGLQAYALPAVSGAGPAWYETSPLLRMAREAAGTQAQPPEDTEDSEDGDCSPTLMFLSESLPQLNLAMGLRSAAYDEEQYVDLLRACCPAYAQRAEALEEAYKVKDAARMRLEAHALHGSLSSIGAELLSQHAAELEMVIYDSLATQVRIQAPAFLAELRDLVERLRFCFERLDDQEVREVREPDLSGYPPLWYETAAAMGRMVAAYDYAGALAQLQTLEWAHAPEDGPWLAAVRRALEAFDYQTLARMLRILPKEA